MSFVGGGTDLPNFYRERDGAVISTAIDKYVYVTVNKKFDDGIRVGYSVNEEVDTIDQIVHPIVRHTMGLCGITGGVEITTVADIPSRGTGLGSSSAFTVGLLNCLSAFQGRYVTAEKLGAEASRIEIELCGQPIGKQDQFASAYGGFNLIEFRGDERVDVTPIVMAPHLCEQLERRIIVFYTGVTRSASAILAEQSAQTAARLDTRQALGRMADLAYQLRDEFQSGTIDTFGEILHENWEIKKSMARGISNPDIDDWYSRARAAGASGGKILGAGAGGFLAFAAPEERHDEIAASLPLRRMKFGFEPLGSRIIFYNP